MVYFRDWHAFPDYGAPRGWTNLFSSSVIALDLKTGAYKWHFQSAHHDMWDYDMASRPCLYDTVINANRASDRSVDQAGLPVPAGSHQRPGTDSD